MNLLSFCKQVKMSSPFEYYFPPIFFQKELSPVDEECYQRFLTCISASSDESFDTESVVSNESDNSEIEILIENKDIGKVIGKGGDIISKIREESGAVIKIFDKRFGSKRKVKISGKESNVSLAKKKIIECLP